MLVKFIRNIEMSSSHHLWSGRKCPCQWVSTAFLSNNVQFYGSSSLVSDPAPAYFVNCYEKIPSSNSCQYWPSCLYIYTVVEVLVQTGSKSFICLCVLILWGKLSLSLVILEWSLSFNHSGLLFHGLKDRNC